MLSRRCDGDLGREPVNGWNVVIGPLFRHTFVTGGGVARGLPSALEHGHSQPREGVSGAESSERLLVEERCGHGPEQGVL